MKTTIPRLDNLSDETLSNNDKLLILSELDLIDTFSKFATDEKSRDVLEKYKALAEVYVMEYEKDIQDYSTFLAVDGAITEIYSDIFKHEKSSGENKRSKHIKDRIMVIRNGFELLKKYIHRTKEAKILLHQSIIARRDLLKENSELKSKLSLINKTFEEADKP